MDDFGFNHCVFIGRFPVIRLRQKAARTSMGMNQRLSSPRRILQPHFFQEQLDRLRVKVFALLFFQVSQRLFF